MAEVNALSLSLKRSGQILIIQDLINYSEPEEALYVCLWEMVTCCIGCLIQGSTIRVSFVPVHVIN